MQRFLRCLNYVANFSLKLKEVFKPLSQVLSVLHPHTFKVVETYALDMGFAGILKQHFDSNSEQLVRLHSAVWTELQLNFKIIYIGR